MSDEFDLLILALSDEGSLVYAQLIVATRRLSVLPPWPEPLIFQTSASLYNLHRTPHTVEPEARRKMLLQSKETDETRPVFLVRILRRGSTCWILPLA